MKMFSRERQARNSSIPVIENVQGCPLCGEAVDKYKHHFECRSCGACCATTSPVMIFEKLASLEEK